MKWRMYNAPEFMKLLTSNTILNQDTYNRYRKFEYGMYTFSEWAGKKLDDIYKKDKEFEPGGLYKLEFGPKDDIEIVREYAQFHIRMCRDPLNGRCGYEEKLKESGLNITKDIKYEYFTFINKPPTFDTVDMMTFIITTVNVKPLSSDTKVDGRITIQCLGYK